MPQVHINLWTTTQGNFVAGEVGDTHLIIPTFQHSPLVDDVELVESPEMCEAHDGCWCEPTTGPAASFCADTEAECSTAGGSCVVSAECTTPVDNLHYMREIGSLVSSVCAPGAPWHDDCGAPDYTLYGVAYWRRRGITDGLQVCGPPSDV